jgi:4-amino-4-deoxy-L-arabinose transferase-like glycosyltransferase
MQRVEAKVIPTQKAVNRPRIYTLAIGAVLLLSLILLVDLSHSKLFWGDEILTYSTIPGKSLVDLLRFQSSTPVVLEPPTNDILLWTNAKIFGYSHLAMRLPSIVFFLLLQYLLYRVATLVGGRRAGLIAATLALGTVLFNYGAEGRPYSFLTALTILAVVLWSERKMRPGGSPLILVALALVVGLAITSQFYGGLIVLPVIVAEATFALLARRRLDVWLLAAMGVGMLGIVLDVPFLHAVHQYRSDKLNNVYLGALWYSYEWGLPSILWLWRLLHLLPRNWIPSILVVVCLASFPLGRKRASEPPPEDTPMAPLPMRRALWAALVTILAYPVPALVFAHFVTHLYYPRYAVQCMAAMAALLGIAFAKPTYFLPRRAAIFLGVLGFGAVTFTAIQYIRLNARQLAQTVGSYEPSADVKAMLAEDPAAPIFLTIEQGILYPFYGDSAYLPRIRCVESVPSEYKYSQVKMTSLTTLALSDHTDFPLKAVSLDDLNARQNVIFAFSPRDWLGWVPAAIQAQGGVATDIGPGFGAEVFRLTFPPQPR